MSHTPDRRIADQPVAAERRHGERRMYGQGCRCTPCRAANAAYEAAYRSLKAEGKTPLGSRVSAARTHIVMKALRAEMSAGQLALRLGWHWNYNRVRRSSRIALRTALKVQRIWRQSRAGLETPPLPFEQADVALGILNGLGRN